MKERVGRPASQFVPDKGGYNLRKRKKNNPDNKGVDRISVLPDEVLVFILSLLPLKEAQVTSILSSRWRYMWAFTMNLNFSAEEALYSLIYLNPKMRKLEMRKYVDWVNSVVKHHRVSRVEQFRICFDLNNEFSSSIDELVKFAMRKGVQKLELDLLRNGVNAQNSISYTFDPHRLGMTKASALKHLCDDIPSPHPCVCNGFKSLKALTFKAVNVAGEVLEYLLSNCPFLARLSVSQAPSLRCLRVVGPSLPLKYLLINDCRNTKSIEICDSKLVSFIFEGFNTNLLLRNVPLLVEVSIVASYDPIGFMEFSLTRLSSCLSQLEILKIPVMVTYKKDRVFPILAKLKHLEFGFDYDDDSILLLLNSFIKASPYLHRLGLWLYPFFKRREMKLKEATKCSHEYLKIVEMLGYDGRTSDFELVNHLIENTVKLEKIVVDPIDPMERRHYFPKSRLKKSTEEEVREEKARNHARQQLIEIIPETIELVCL